MKKIHVLWMMLFLILVTACGTMNKVMQVHEGMSRKEITQLFGTPNFRRFDGGEEEWEYRKVNIMGETEVIIVVFLEGRVAGMNTFKQEEHNHPAPPPCIH